MNIRPFLALSTALLLSGCASEEPFKNSASMDQIYDAVCGFHAIRTLSPR
ncbi:hypothetical protein QYP02_34720 [Pseudomonas aeruginosa]|nr:hypothetical protein [Pseudomonas aeruginosa]